MDWTRSMGILFFDQGVVIRAYPNEEDRTDIEVNAETKVGAIVRHSKTGKWRYTESLRVMLGLEDDPEFDSDLDAGKELAAYLPPLSQVRDNIRALLRMQNLID